MTRLVVCKLGRRFLALVIRKARLRNVQNENRSARVAMLRISDEVRGEYVGQLHTMQQGKCAAVFFSRWGGGGGRGRRNQSESDGTKKKINGTFERVQLHARTCRDINLTSSAQDETGLWR